MSAEQPAPETLHFEGRRVGAWEILGEIGRGGMSVVYLVRRADGAFQMQAALKVLNSPFGDEETRKRFQQEREILAQLDNPHIARLLDGGATDEGLPYLVMEYVDGEPLTGWCDARKASIDERLRLFAQLCDVVEYLHEHHVIHRDLKPNNVLVTAAGSVKLLDSGVSKLLAPVLDRTILATRSGLHLLTPEYASPEQARGDAVTPQSDIYALGVILYELLTGRRPYRLRSRVVHEVLRAICEEEPERPSTAAIKRDDSADPITVSRLRQSSPERLTRMLNGDLDEIVLKALRKAPERRYRTARQLADDLSAHAQGRSISVRGDSWKIRLFKLLTRHRAAVALLIMLAALLASGVVKLNARSLIYLGAGALVVGFWYRAASPKTGGSVTKSRGFFDRGFFDLNAIWAYPLFIAIYAALYAGVMFFIQLVVAGVSHLSTKLGPLSYDFFITALAAPALAELVSLRRWFDARSWAGAVILNLNDCPKVHSGYLIKMVISLLICTGNVLLVLLVTPDSREDIELLHVSLVFAMLLLWVTASHLKNSLTHGKLEFRQMAIVYNGRLIPWDEIESWRWDSETLFESYDGSVILEVCQGGTIRASRFRIHVSPGAYDNVTRVMNQHLSEWPSNQIAPVMPVY